MPRVRLADSYADAHRNDPLADRDRAAFRSRYASPASDCMFGDLAYSYSGILHEPAPFPAIVQRLRERAEALSGTSFNAVLANFYRDGRDSVGWHSDSEAGLGDCPTIASLSLGGTRRFQFRHRKTKETITLELKTGHLANHGWPDPALLAASGAQDHGARGATS